MMSCQNPKQTWILWLFFIGFAVISGCTYHVPLDETPDKTADRTAEGSRIPLTVGIYFSPEFVNYEYVHKQIHRWVLPLGEASVSLFNRVFPPVFDRYVTIEGRPFDTAARGLDAVIEPAIESYSLQFPRYPMLSGEYETSITYRFNLFNIDGDLISSWSVTALARREATMEHDAAAEIGEVTDAAMREAANKFLAGLHDRREIQDWPKRAGIPPPGTSAPEPPAASRAVAVRARPENDSGSVQTYDAPFDRVWDSVPGVAQELGLSPVESNKNAGYQLIERKGVFGENVSVFVERVDADRTKVRVISTSSFPLISANWEPQILGNLDRKLKDPSYESHWIRRNLYVSWNFDFGQVGQKIQLHRQSPSGSQSIGPEDLGVIMSLVAGYDVNRYLSVEISGGFLSYGGTNCYYSSCRSDPGYLDAEFSTYPVTASLLYHFYRNDIFPASEHHLELGVRYHFSPEFYKKEAGSSTEVKYNDALGYQAGIGGSFGTRFFFSYDLKYVFGLKYRFKEMEENGVKSSTATFPDWKELDGSGILVGFGLGYHF